MHVWYDDHTERSCCNWKVSSGLLLLGFLLFLWLAYVAIVLTWKVTDLVQVNHYINGFYYLQTVVTSIKQTTSGMVIGSVFVATYTS